jgi:hypothetical protein
LVRLANSVSGANGLMVKCFEGLTIYIILSRLFSSQKAIVWRPVGDIAVSTHGQLVLSVPARCKRPFIGTVLLMFVADVRGECVITDRATAWYSATLTLGKQGEEIE